MQFLDKIEKHAAKQKKTFKFQIVWVITLHHAFEVFQVDEIL